MTEKDREKAIEILRVDDISGYSVEDILSARDMAIKSLEQEPIFSRILEKTYNDFCNCGGGEGWLEIDGKEYVTDAGYAIEGVKIFMEIFKRRLAESGVEE